MDTNFVLEEKALIIGLGEYRVGSTPMGTIGLGSCVALILHDPKQSRGGLAHVMLPESRGKTDRPGKFADTALSAIMDELEALGSTKSTILAHVIGGACMFEYSANALNVGERNITAVKDLLQERCIRVEHEDTGGKMGRSVFYYPDKGGRLIIKRADGTCITL
jgi:chemotaxis protein CheD